MKSRTSELETSIGIRHAVYIITTLQDCLGNRLSANIGYKKHSTGLLLISITQTHLCTITLFTKPAASTVCVSSSSVRFGKVVPIVYGRVRFSGRDL